MDKYINIFRQAKFILPLLPISLLEEASPNRQPLSCKAAMNANTFSTRGIWSRFSINLVRFFY